jgi:hypothetical protein
MEKKEQKNERFKRLASRRTEKILNDLRVLGNCSNKSVYSFTDEEVNKIFYSIEEQLRIVKSRFRTIRHKKFSL